MKLILATLCLVLSIIGQVFAAYMQEWTSFFIASPFTAQFACLLCYTYNKYRASMRKLDHLKALNAKLIKALRSSKRK